MRSKRAPQSLSYPIRLPDGMQADALRLLDVSRSVINATVVALWDRLDEFGERETKYAYKQVTALMDAPAFYGDRLWRCQAEQAGRILRGQAERKKQCALILPLLEQGMILPKTEKKRAGKNRRTIKAALTSLREEDSDGAVPWNYKASLNRREISTLHMGASPTPMKTCKPFLCSRWASCPMQETMAAR